MIFMPFFSSLSQRVIAHLMESVKNKKDTKHILMNREYILALT